MTQSATVEGITAEQVQQWADRAGLSDRIPRDHLALAAALSAQGHAVEVVRYQVQAIWDNGTKKSMPGWFLRGPFGFFSLENAASETELRTAREQFLEVLYAESGAGHPTRWEWHTEIALPATWRAGVDSDRLAALRGSWPPPAPLAASRP